MERIFIHLEYCTKARNRDLFVHVVYLSISTRNGRILTSDYCPKSRLAPSHQKSYDVGIEDHSPFFGNRKTQFPMPCWGSQTHKFIAHGLQLLSLGRCEWNRTFLVEVFMEPFQNYEDHMKTLWKAHVLNIVLGESLHYQSMSPSVQWKWTFVIINAKFCFPTGQVAWHTCQSRSVQRL